VQECWQPSESVGRETSPAGERQTASVMVPLMREAWSLVTYAVLKSHVRALSITSWSGFCAEICSSPKVLSVRNVVLTRPNCLALQAETLDQKRLQTEKRRVARRSRFEIAAGGRETGHAASCCGRWRYCDGFGSVSQWA